MFKSLQTILMTVTVLLLMMGCTKKRPLKFLDSQLRDGLVTKSLVDNSVYSLKTTDKVVYTSLSEADNQGWLAANHPFYRVEVSGVPEELYFMFDELYIPAPPHSSYQFLLQSDRRGVTGYVLTSDISEFPLIQQQLATEYESDEALKKIPIFYYDIQSYGQPVARRNALEEKTNEARLKQTNWQKASHIYLKPTATERHPIGLIGNAQRDWERIFVADQIQNQVITAGDLETYRIHTNLEESQEVVLKIQERVLYVFEVTDIHSPHLSEAERNLVKKGEASERVRYCVGIPALSDRGECLLVGRYIFNISRIEADRNMVDRGELGKNVVFRTDRTKGPAGLIRIAEGQKPIYFTPDGRWDPRQYYRLKDLLEKKFYFRRTIQDHPVGLGPGLVKGVSGSLMLVKFQVVEGKVQVVTSGPSLTLPYLSDGASGSDIETIMSLPAKFYRAEYKDSYGNPLEVPVLVETTYRDITDEIYVQFDWTKGDINEVGSLLSLAGVFAYGKCFMGGGDTRVDQFDNRLEDDGVLSFTVQATYTGNPSCFSNLGYTSVSNYFGKLDVNMRIQERFSFKVHNPDDNQAPSHSLGLRPSVEKAFGYGSISFPHKKPHERGDARLSDDIEYRPIIWDFKIVDGEVHRPMKWYLKGVPEKSSYKEYYQRYELKPTMTYETYYRLVEESMGEIFGDLNEKFRRAFRGTPLETSEDLFEYDIVSEKDDSVIVGNLDKNIIVFDPRPMEGGLLGVYFPLGNSTPKSRKIVNSHVTVFAGVISRSIGRIRWAAEIKKRKIDQINAKLNTFSRDNELPTISEVRNQLSYRQTTNPWSQVTNPESFEAHLGAFSLQEEKGQLVREMGLRPILESFDRRFYFEKIGPHWDTSAVERLKMMGQGESLNISSLLDAAYENNDITKEEYSYTLFQRLVDRHGDGNMSKLMQLASNPTRFKVAFLEEFLHAPMGSLSSSDLMALSKEYIELKGMANFMEHNDALNMDYCFNEIHMGDDSIVLNLTEEEIFKGFFSKITQHEILHAMGLSHQFEGSVDQENFEFKGERTGRKVSGIMEYPSLGGYVVWKGMGPHDVHAIRAMYTGMVEVHPEIMADPDSWIKDSPSGQYLQVSTQQSKYISFHDGLIDLRDLKERVFPYVDWVDISKQDIDSMKIVKKYMYCSDQDVGWDTLCFRGDRGIRPEEIVQNTIQDHENNYWVTHFPNDRESFGWRNIVRNHQLSIRSFLFLRHFSDFFLRNVVLEKDVQLQESMAKATLLSRNYLLSAIQAPEPQSKDEYSITFPMNINFSTSDGQQGSTIVANHVIPKQFYSNVSSDNMISDVRYNRLGNFWERMLVFDMLTIRLTTYNLEQDRMVPLRFSYLDAENMLRVPPAQSPIIHAIRSYLAYAPKAMALVNDGQLLYDLPLPIARTKMTPGLSFMAAKAGVLNLYSNVLESDSFNLSNLFRVYSSKLGELSGEQPFVLDISNDIKNEAHNRTYHAEGEQENSWMAYWLITQAAVGREIFEEETQLNMASREYIDTFLNSIINDSQEGQKDSQLMLARSAFIDKYNDKIAFVAREEVGPVTKAAPTSPTSHETPGQELISFFESVVEPFITSDDSVSNRFTYLAMIEYGNPMFMALMTHFFDGAFRKLDEERMRIRTSQVPGQPLQSIQSGHIVYRRINEIKSIFDSENARMRTHMGPDFDLQQFRGIQQRRNYNYRKSSLELMNILYSYIDRSARYNSH